MSVSITSYHVHGCMGLYAVHACTHHSLGACTTLVPIQHEVHHITIEQRQVASVHMWCGVCELYGRERVRVKAVIKVQRYNHIEERIAHIHRRAVSHQSSQVSQSSPSEVVSSSCVEEGREGGEDGGRRTCVHACYVSIHCH